MNIPARLLFLYPVLSFCFLVLKADAADSPLLPRPQTHVLDQSGVLLPETIAKLNAEFQKAEQQNSLHIYLLTLPYIKAPSVDRKTKLEETANLYATAWIQGVGALILFDDQSGLVTVAYSTDAKAFYSEIALDQVLKTPLQEVQFNGLTREKLELASNIVVRVMQNLQQETALKAPGSHTGIKFFVGVLLFLAVVLIVYKSAGNSQPIKQVVPPEPKRSRRRRKADRW